MGTIRTLRTWKARAGTFTLLAGILVAPAAWAQDDTKVDPGPATHEPEERSGVTGGLAVGAGELHIIPNDGDEQVSTGAGLSMRFGTAVSQNAVIMGILEWVSADTQSNVLLGLAYQGYFARRWFFRLGGGGVRFHLKGSIGPTGTSSSTTKYSGGGLIGFGWEFLQLRTMALDFETTAMVSYQDDLKATMLNWSVMVGAQWY